MNALSRRAGTLIAGGAYLVFALVVTWPWVLRPTSTLYGTVGGDQTASIAYFQQLIDAGLVPFLPGTIGELNVPEGMPVDWALNLAGGGSTLVLWLLSLVLGAVAAHGTVAVLGYSLSALAMFLLVRRLTGHSGVAFAVGLAFGFWAFTYPTGWTWPHYIHGWVFVLLAWRMLVAFERPSLSNGILAGAAAVVAMTWIQYYLLIGGVAFAAMLVAVLVATWRRDDRSAHLRAQGAASAVVLAGVAAIAVAGFATGFEGAPTRAEGDAYLNSARPLMYVLPGPLHPIFGDSIGDWLVRKYPSPFTDPSTTATVQAIYIGLPLLMLGAAGLVLLARRRIGHLAGIGLAAAWITLVGLLFSAPPRVNVLGVELPMPYTLVNEVTPVFRAASRFSMLVMMGVCVLAALALAFFVARRRPAVQVAVLASVAIVFAVDGWARPKRSTARVTHPPIYDVLARQPQGVVAEYPLSEAAVSRNRESLYQDVHEHPMFGGWADGTPSAARKLALKHLRARGTASTLAVYGVRYVLVRPKGGSGSTMLPPPARPIPGLRQVARARGGTLYRVVARPPRFWTAPARGFEPPEGSGGGVQWAHANDARLELHGKCSPCAGTLVVDSGTFVRARNLTVTDDSGRVLLRSLIGSSSMRVRFRVRFSRSTTLHLRMDPPPERIDDVLHNGDTRRFGVFVGSRIRFMADKRAGHRWTTDA